MKRDMNLIELKPSELALAVADAIRANVVPIVLASPGMGKSDVIRQTIKSPAMLEYFKSNFGTKEKPVKEVRMVDERTSTMDLTDWRGVPDIDRKAKRTVWYPPNFLPAEDDAPTVVFFDEITQTPTNCQPPLYQLLLDRKLGTVYNAPKSTRFVAAGNLMDDGTFANKIGSALRDRMVALYMKPDLEDWCRWAYANGIAPVVIAFIRFKPELLYAFDKTAWASPTARGWEFVSRIVLSAQSTGRVRDALIEGKIGHGTTIEFTAFERIFATLPSIDAILLNPDTAQLPERSKPELAYAIANALSIKATVNNLDRAITYLNRMPEEYSVFAVKTATKRDPKLQTVPAFTKWCVDHAAAMS